MPEPWPEFIPTAALAGFFHQRHIAHRQYPRLALGFGVGRPQYQLFNYALPSDQCTMGLFFEWHTADYFDAPANAHLAVGCRGPLASDPHRGRGLALGMLSNAATNEHGQAVPLFSGCADPPGGPALFLEEFTVNDGHHAINDWQLSEALQLPRLRGDAVFRVDLLVTRTGVEASVWERQGQRYDWLGHRSTGLHPPAGRGVGPHPHAGLHEEDQGVGNAFIGNGFAREDNRSIIDSLFIAHWP